MTSIFLDEYLLPKALNLAGDPQFSGGDLPRPGGAGASLPEHPKNVYLEYNGCATRAQFDALLEKRRRTPPGASLHLCHAQRAFPAQGQAHAIQALAALHRKGINANLLLAGGGRQD